MRNITVEDVIHTESRTQITPVALINVVFLKNIVSYRSTMCIQVMATVTANILHRRLSNVITYITDCDHLTAVRNEFMKNKQ